MNPEGLPFFINPSVTSCHLPYVLHSKTQRRSFKISSIVKIEIPRKATGHKVTEELNFSRIYSAALIIHQEDRNALINKRFIANIQV